MREVSYVLRFERPNGDAPTVATGLVTETVLGDGGEPLTTTRTEKSGTAHYHSTYTVDPDGVHFTEQGTIEFGESDADSLAFSTIDRGTLLPPADPETGMTRGIVMWTVDSGTGYFAGASGLIASNFRVNLTTEALVDDHVGTIWLPDEEDA